MSNFGPIELGYGFVEIQVLVSENWLPPTGRSNLREARFVLLKSSHELDRIALVAYACPDYC